MKFQVDILSGSKVTEGDGPTDRPTDGPTLRFLEIHAGSKKYGSEKNQLQGAKYSLCIRIHCLLTKYKILRILGIFGGFLGDF